MCEPPLDLMHFDDGLMKKTASNRARNSTVNQSVFPEFVSLIFASLSLRRFPKTDQDELHAAKNFLEQAAASNLPDFLRALSDVLVYPGNSSVARMAAGLQLKNHLTSKDETIKQQYQERWRSFPEDVKEYIRKNVSVFGAVVTHEKSGIHVPFSSFYRSWAHLVPRSRAHRLPLSAWRTWP